MLLILRWVFLSSIGLLSVGAGTFVKAAFPERAIRLIVPYPAGGPTDVLARRVGDGIKLRLGQPVIIDNRAGAGSNIGAEAVANAPADGYTLLFGTSAALAINVSLYTKIGYDPIKSFDPIIMIGKLPNVLIVNSSLPVKGVQELVEYAKSGKRQLSYASSGNGATSHLTGAMFNARTGTDILHIPYRGTGPALNDLIGGQVQMTFTDVLTALPHIEAGTVRALGVTTNIRSAVLPNVPTFEEQGLKDFDVTVFFGVVAPKGTDPGVIARLNGTVADLLKESAVKTVLSEQGIIPAPSTDPEFFAGYMADEITKWRAVVKSVGAEIK